MAVATALGAVEGAAAAAVGEVEAVRPNKLADVVADVIAARPSKQAVGRAKVGDVVEDMLAARPSKLAARPSAGAGSGERAPCPRGCISPRPTTGFARPERRASLRANVTGTIISIYFNGIV